MNISLFYEVNFLYSLVVTVLIEWIVVYLLASFYLKIELKKSDIFAIGIVPSFATLPYVWFIFPFLFKDNHLLYILVSESFVVVVEMFLLSYFLKLNLKNGLLLSFVANLASYSIGSWLAKIL